MLDTKIISTSLFHTWFFFCRIINFIRYLPLCISFRINILDRDKKNQKKIKKQFLYLSVCFCFSFTFTLLKDLWIEHKYFIGMCVYYDFIILILFSFLFVQKFICRTAILHTNRFFVFLFFLLLLLCAKRNNSFSSFFFLNVLILNFNDFIMLKRKF